MAKNSKGASCCHSDFGVHAVGKLLVGMGLGVLLTYPVFGAHPVRWGLGLIVLGVLIFCYPKLKK